MYVVLKIKCHILDRMYFLPWCLYIFNVYIFNVNEEILSVVDIKSDNVPSSRNSYKVCLPYIGF